jgi:pimeloyl-ACP methyl ester carboxylesterase
MLQDYVDRTIDAVNASKDCTILVGHSMGGGIIHQVTEFIPGRIRALVHVAALLPPNGSSMMKFVDGFDPEYLAQFVWAQDRRTVRIRPEGARTFLYSHCPAATIESALPLLTAEPVAPFEATLSWTEANIGRVPRHYIECLQDRVIPIALQRAMRLGVSFDCVYSLDTDHCPFFSTPEEFATILHGIGEEI